MIPILAVFLYVAPSCLREETASSAPEASESIVAYVNGREISLTDFLVRYEREVASRPDAPGDPVSVLNARIAFLGRLVDRILVFQEAHNLGIVVEDRETEAAEREIREDYPVGEFERALAERGIDIESWRAALRERLLERKVVREVVAPTIHISDEEVAGYYQTRREEFEQRLRVHASQILVATEDEARQAVDRLARGADFAVLAQEVSTAPERNRGGDLGFFEPGDLPAEMDEVLFELPVGRVSGIVRTGYGYHIFLVTERREPRVYTLEDARERIVAVLRDSRLDGQYNHWIGNLRARAEISINEALLGR